VLARAIACSLLSFAFAAAQQPVEPWRAQLAEHGVTDRGWSRKQGTTVELLAAPLRIEGLGAGDQAAPAAWCLARLEDVVAEVRRMLGHHAMRLPATLRVVLCTEDRVTRRLCRGFVGTEAQALGAFGGTPPTLVLQVPTTADAVDLRRLFAHSLATLALESWRLDRSGLGWLQVGCAHSVEARFGDGLCENFVLQGHPQTPRRFHGGDWRTGVRELLEAGSLPALADVVARDADEFDFAQHALAFAMVEFLLRQSAPTVTGGERVAEAPPLERLFDAGLPATPGVERLVHVLGKGLPAIERDLHAFVRSSYPRR
jgi:hypothetical protein